MQKVFLLLSFFLTTFTNAQNDTSQILRAFPVTDYMVDLNDTTKLLQLEMPEGLTLKNKQLGLIYGVYKTSRDEAVQKGYGQCQLIKGQYYYFAISHNTSGLDIKKGDLLYTFMEKTPVYQGRCINLAAHFIRLLDVTDQPFYDRYFVFNKWTKDDEKDLIDTLTRDIRFTGDYFLKNDPSMNQLIKSGDYKGKMLLEFMSTCKNEDVESFLDYMIARPRLYAGGEWKIAEIFATWLSEGAPKVRD